MYRLLGILKPKQKYQQYYSLSLILKNKTTNMDGCANIECEKDKENKNLISKKYYRRAEHR